MSQPAPSLSLRLLGPLEATLGPGEPARPVTGRAAALLGFFALHPGPRPRNRVASVLWPDVLDTSARASLRSAMWALRRTLGPAADDRLIATRGAVGLVDDEWLRTDLRAFSAAVAEGRHEAALALHRGPLLEGIEADWVLVERTVIEERVGEVLGALTDAALARGDAAAAVAWARRRVAAAPLDEAATRSLMAALAAGGEAAAALQVYRRLAERLGRELRVAPAPATRERAAQLHVGNGAHSVPSPGAPPATRAPSAAPPVVGREPELAALDAASAALEDGPARVVVLDGEAGIGKTTLAGALLRRLEARGARAASCTGTAIGEPAPYAQWVELVAALGRPAGPGAPPGDTLAPPELRRASMRESAVDVVACITARAPVALLLDDANAIDTRTLELIGYVVRRLAARPLLVVLTRRAFPRSPAVDALKQSLRARGIAVRTLELRPLGATEIGHLVRAHARLDARAVERIVAVADGNPLLAVEAARAVERGEEVSAGLRDVVRASIGRLPRAARELAELVAVAGGRLGANAVPAAGPADAAEDALGSGLLVGDGDGLRYRHALLRDAVEDDIPSPRRILLHRRAAALAGDPVDRARHLRHAGCHRRAARALAEAADRALGLGAVDEAADLLTEAIEVTDDDATLHLALARARAWRGDGPGAEAALARAIELHDPRQHAGLGRIWLEAVQWYRSSLCDPRRTRDAAAHALRYLRDAPALRAEALAAYAWAHAMLGAVGEADRHAAEAERLDTEGRLTFDLALVRAHLAVLRRRPEDALAAFEDAAGAIRPAGRPDLAYSVWVHAAAVAALAGDLERALRYAERCLEDAGRIAHLRVASLAARAHILARLGRREDALADAALQRDLARAVGDPSLCAVAEHDAGMVAAVSGDHLAAVSHLTAALASGARVSRPSALLARAEAHARLGHAAAAERDLREVVLSPLRPSDMPAAMVARLTWIQGLSAAARGDVQLARTRLQEAAAGWERLLADGRGRHLEGWMANIVDLGRPPAAGLLEPAIELRRTRADLAAVTVAPAG